MPASAPLFDINLRWRDTQHPHAILDEHDGRWRYFCPRCKTKGEKTSDTLLGAMNFALVHKGRCAAVS